MSARVAIRPSSNAAMSDIDHNHSISSLNQLEGPKETQAANVNGIVQKTPEAKGKDDVPCSCCPRHARVAERPSVGGLCGL